MTWRDRKEASDALLVELALDIAHELDQRNVVSDSTRAGLRRAVIIHHELQRLGAKLKSEGGSLER